MTPASPDERVAGATLKERTDGRGWQLIERIETAYERGEIDAAEWHRRIGAIIGLMECAFVWLAESGCRIEPYGLEILPELAGLARQRLPDWADRIVVGNAIDWIPERRFDFVRTGVEYVPRRLRNELLRHMLDAAVAPGGRLIIGPHSELSGSFPKLQAEVSSWGFHIAGAVEVPHSLDHRVVRRAFWLEKAMA